MRWVRRPEFLLWIGAGVGLALALGGLAAPARSSARGVPAGSVALVNGERISRAAYDAASKAVGESEHRPVTDADKKAVLDRLIDDELMVQQGLSLGMVRGDPPTRNALLNAVYASARASAEALVPTDAELEKFYAQVRSQFAGAGDVRVRELAVNIRDAADRAPARARAAEAVERLRRGESFDAVNAALGSPSNDASPSAPLSPDNINRRFGPVLLERLLEMKPGQVTEPVGDGQAFRVVVLVDRGPPRALPLSEIRDHVADLYRRKAADDAFAAKMDELRRAADVRKVATLP
jgi:parvulin-like peptidyl-prolyl isomerase